MTRKELIDKTNTLVATLSVFESEFVWQRLYHCKAYYAWFRLGVYHYAVLKSYNTVVALYSSRTGTVYEFDRYSTTTTQHVRKFAHYMNADRITKLHKDSTGVVEDNFYTGRFCPTKQEWKNLIEQDYSMEIETIHFI